MRAERVCGSLFLAALFACGARSGLPDGSGGSPFSTYDVSDDVQEDAGVDADANADADADIDADADADAETLPDVEVVKTDCTDPDQTQIYVITNDNELLAFDPPSATFKLISMVDCPTFATPFSMAVDRKGIAYSVFNDGSLFKINLATGACAATDFAIDQQGFHTFGMGYSTDEGGPSETLFIAADGSNGVAPRLGKIDTTSFEVEPVGLFNPALSGMELTGTGDGRLYGFVGDPGGLGTKLVRVDKQTAEATEEASFPSLSLGSGWAFAFWGGDFWFFTSIGNTSVVTRYEVATGQRYTVGTWPSLIVGAGVSTCAPEH